MKEEKKKQKIETLELYLLMIGNPKRAFTLIKDESLKYSYASKILFAVSWWMILVYHQTKKVN